MRNFRLYETTSSKLQFGLGLDLLLVMLQALQIMKFRESGDQDNDHEGNSEVVVIKIMITKCFLKSRDQDNDH